MNEVQFHIYEQESGDAFDVSDLVHNITHTTTLLGYGGKLTFELEKDPNKILKISVGSTVKFWHNDNKIFKGYIFTIQTNGSGTYSVTAYDQLRYWQNHVIWVQEKGNTIVTVFDKICDDLKIPIANRNKKTYKGREILIGHHVFNDVSYFEVFNNAVDETVANTANGSSETLKNLDFHKGLQGLDYLQYSTKPFVRDNFGILELCDIRSNVLTKHIETNDVLNQIFNKYSLVGVPELEPLIIGNESLLINFNYEIDVDKDTYTQIMITQNDKKTGKKNEKIDMQLIHVLPEEETEEIKKYGVLRKIVNVNKESDIDEIKKYAELLLITSAQASKKLSLECLGIDCLNAGDGFVLRIPQISDTKRFNIMTNEKQTDMMVYIISATHTYNEGVHKMSLEVSTPEHLMEVV